MPAHCAIGREALNTLVANYPTDPTPDVVDRLSGLASDMLLAVVSNSPRPLRSAQSQVSDIESTRVRRDLVDASAHAIAASLSSGLSPDQLGIVLNKLALVKQTLLEPLERRAGALPSQRSAFQQLLAKRAA